MQLLVCEGPHVSRNMYGFICHLVLIYVYQPLITSTCKAATHGFLHGILFLIQKVVASCGSTSDTFVFHHYSKMMYASVYGAVMNFCSNRPPLYCVSVNICL